MEAAESEAPVGNRNALKHAGGDRSTKSDPGIAARGEGAAFHNPCGVLVDYHEIPTDTRQRLYRSPTSRRP